MTNLDVRSLADVPEGAQPAREINHFTLYDSAWSPSRMDALSVCMQIWVRLYGESSTRT